MFIRSVREAIGDRPLASVQSGTTIREAAHVLEQFNVGAVAVLAGEQLVGILSERDVIQRCIAHDADPATTRVDEAMTADPVTVGADAGLSDAIGKFAEGGYRHLPVMQGGHCIGILSVRDVPAEYRMMYDRFQEMRARPAGA
jgi:CBS domain-containing protein